jgi:hypothetical protein
LKKLPKGFEKASKEIGKSFKSASEMLEYL